MTPRKVRAWVILDAKIYKEIEGYAKEAGVKTSQYLNLATVLGARTLARVASPEKFFTPELIEKLAEQYEKESQVK